MIAATEILTDMRIASVGGESAAMGAVGGSAWPRAEVIGGVKMCVNEGWAVVGLALLGVLFGWCVRSLLNK